MAAERIATDAAWEGKKFRPGGIFAARKEKGKKE